MTENLMSVRQLKTVASIPTAQNDLHCGPYGSGKTYAVNTGLGVACSASDPPPGNTCIALVGKTAMAVKNNICNDLASKFGSNFRYDSGKKDGFTKDAVLFNHRLRIIGLNDSSAESRIRGLNTYKIIGDEMSTWSEENFKKILGRLRGEKPENWEFGFVGTTNPDSPKHWLKKLIDGGESINYVQWTEEDIITASAKAYYEMLRKQYKNNQAYYNRYILGQWSAADGLVYTQFRDKEHVLSRDFIKRVKFVSYRIGVDFGTTNPSAILLIGVTEEKEYVVVKEVYIKEATLSQVTGRIIALSIEASHKLSKIYVDPSAKVLIKQLKEEGVLTVEGGNNSVFDGIDYVKDLFSSDRLYISEDCPNLIEELYTYSYADSDMTKVVKAHDHASDALRYGLYS